MSACGLLCQCKIFKLSYLISRSVLEGPIPASIRERVPDDVVAPDGTEPGRKAPDSPAGPQRRREPSSSSLSSSVSSSL